MVRYKIVEEQTSAKMGEETVLLDHKNGFYFGLNTVGSFIWEELLKSPKTFEELKKAVLEEYDIDEITCDEDLKKLLEDLITQRLISKDA